MEPNIPFYMKYIATCLFACAVLHTFAVSKFNQIASRYRPGSMGENFFHFLAEVEVVFGLWATVLIAIWSMIHGTASAVTFLESLNYTEAIFVFVIMCMAATKPILDYSQRAIHFLADLIPVQHSASLFVITLIAGPLLGSVITEPASMTLTAILLKSTFFDKPVSLKFKYATLGLLFVNVSIGGTLTHFAAPPVLMVASAWGWDTPFMFTHFGLKVLPSIVISTLLTAIFFRKEFAKIDVSKELSSKNPRPPVWIFLVQVVFLAMTIFQSHHIAFFIPVFLIFLGWCKVSNEFQSDIRIKESLLVGFFLGGLVVLGKLQDWWLQPAIGSLEPKTLFLGAAGLTALTDNAALTYLGTLISSLTPEAKYFLVAGAVSGGGLTVIANAPNPAGNSLLKDSFGESGISPLGLFLGALPYTIFISIIFLFF
jgi:hypothetical protein